MSILAIRLKPTDVVGTLYDELGLKLFYPTEQFVTETEQLESVREGVREEIIGEAHHLILWKDRLQEIAFLLALFFYHSLWAGLLGFVIAWAIENVRLYLFGPSRMLAQFSRLWLVLRIPVFLWMAYLLWPTETFLSVSLVLFLVLQSGLHLLTIATLPLTILLASILHKTIGRKYPLGALPEGLAVHWIILRWRLKLFPADKFQLSSQQKLRRTRRQAIFSDKNEPDPSWSLTVDEQFDPDQEDEGGPGKAPMGTSGLALRPCRDLAEAGDERRRAHRVMMHRDLVCRRVGAVAVEEQQHAADQGEHRKRHPPDHVPHLVRPPQHLDSPHAQKQDRVELVLDGLPVVAEIGVSETFVADRPGFVIAPDHQIAFGAQHCERQQKARPGQHRDAQSAAQLAEPDQQHEHSRQAMVELGIGDALRRAVPLRSGGGRGVMMVRRRLVRGAMLLRH